MFFSQLFAMQVLVLECDATKPDDNKITIEQTIEKFGRLDCLVSDKYIVYSISMKCVCIV